MPRNKFEQKIDKQLQKSKLVYKYEAKKIPYVLACHYTPDWTIQTKTGWVIVETKGYFRASDKRKMVAVKKQHPELDLRIVFYKENEEYIRWANRNGFKWAINTIPQTWLDGL